MRIDVDRSRCEGLGMCEAMAHELFEVGDDGFVVVLDEAPDEGQRSFIRAAIDSCPVSALSLRD
ncbi:ferredoxin [Nocardioides sp.]|uniref:ferredoxin n=1 Tax=Nocardioides sp. TaxID=35761 RepID=UPI002C25ADC1|nr:ferredoxin [Nocardioides sp.]HSX68231.1 ferredoxin [Nocardioides sp.]